MLFGSFVKGKVNDNSDIDLYIDTNGKLKRLVFVGLMENFITTYLKMNSMRCLLH